jgi:hypothetical protein
MSSSRSFRHGYSPRLGFSFFRASERTFGLDSQLKNCFDFAIAVAIGYQTGDELWSYVISAILWPSQKI